MGYPKLDNSSGRKFWSQTSDNMDRWKAEMGRVREEKRKEEKRREEKRREEERISKRESLRRKKIQVHKKIGKSLICDSGGSNIRLAKAAGAQHCNYNSTTLRCGYDRNYDCTTPHYIQQLWWGDHCNHSKKTQLQPAFSPSVDSLCHSWFGIPTTTTTSTTSTTSTTNTTQ